MARKSKRARTNSSDDESFGDEVEAGPSLQHSSVREIKIGIMIVCVYTWSVLNTKSTVKSRFYELTGSEKK
jgi:hypothetical protein